VTGIVRAVEERLGGLHAGAKPSGLLLAFSCHDILVRRGRVCLSRRGCASWEHAGALRNSDTFQATSPYFGQDQTLPQFRPQIAAPGSIPAADVREGGPIAAPSAWPQVRMPHAQLNHLNRPPCAQKANSGARAVSGKSLLTTSELWRFFPFALGGAYSGYWRVIDSRTVCTTHLLVEDPFRTATAMCSRGGVSSRHEGGACSATYLRGV
jgi:hypothetical protein